MYSTNEVKILNLVIQDLGKRNSTLRKENKKLREEINYLRSNLEVVARGLLT